MKRLLLIFVVLCGAALAQSELPTPIQTCSANATTCAFTNNVVSGNLIYIGAHSEGVLTTPTDTRSTTWTLVGSKTGGADAFVWCGVLGSSGAETITLTGSLSFQGQINMEFPAFAGLTCTTDGSAVTGTPPSGTLTTSGLTTTDNGELMLCYVSSSSSGQAMGPHLGGAFLGIGAQGGSDSGAFAYRFSGTNGSYTCSVDNTNSNGAYVLVAFSPSAATAVTNKLPSGSLTNSYSFTPQCVGGIGAYTWTASSLPTGLSINSSTGAITGTPTGGTTTPTITCTGATSGAASLSTAPLTVNSSVGTMSIVSSLAITSGGTSGSLGTVTAGNCILISSWISNNTNIAAPSDNLGTPTVFHYVGNQISPGQFIGNALWYGNATTTGTDTVTVSAINGSAIIQIANCQAFADTASSNGGVNAGSVTISGNAITTLAPGSEVWATIVGFSGSTTWTAGTGFSTSGDATVTNQPMQGIHANESSTGSYTPSFVQTGNADGHWAVWGIGVRPSTSGVVNTNHRRAWVTNAP